MPPGVMGSGVIRRPIPPPPRLTLAAPRRSTAFRRQRSRGFSPGYSRWQSGLKALFGFRLKPVLRPGWGATAPLLRPAACAASRESIESIESRESIPSTPSIASIFSIGSISGADAAAPTLHSLQLTAHNSHPPWHPTASLIKTPFILLPLSPPSGAKARSPARLFSAISVPAQQAKIAALSVIRGNIFLLQPQSGSSEWLKGCRLRSPLSRLSRLSRFLSQREPPFVDSWLKIQRVSPPRLRCKGSVPKM